MFLKTHIIYIILFLFSLPVAAQKDILSDMQGLELKGDLVFEIDGYSMLVQKEKASLNDKGIKKIKKKYGLENVSKEYSDKNIKWENRVIETTEKIEGLPDVEGFKKCYLLPEDDNNMRVVMLHSVAGRDTVIENAFMDALFARKLKQYTTDDWVAESIDFAGRTIELGDMCRWVSPRNVHCATFGQMAWTELDTQEEAEVNNMVQLISNNNSKKYKPQKEEEVDILFEGIPTKAKRVTYKLNTPKILMGGRNMLVTYFVTQKVRGKHVSAVLTHYMESKDDYSLPPLLERVMSLKEN